MTTVELRAAIEVSRAALIRAIQSLSERDFAAELAPSEPIVLVLAALAPAEREAVNRAREAVGAVTRLLSSERGSRTWPVPPQVIHDLSGARHETLSFLDSLDGGTFLSGAKQAALDALQDVSAREMAAAVRIEARPQSS